MKRKDCQSALLNGNTSHKWTGKMPSASFKIGVVSHTEIDFRTQATVRRIPRRGRGAVFGDLSLMTEQVNSSASVQLGGGIGVSSERVLTEADADDVSDMDKDLAQKFGGTINGIHALRRTVQRDLIQSCSRTPDVETLDSTTGSLNDDSYLQDIDSDNSDSELWDALAAHEAVLHSTRYRLMSASGRRRPQSSPALGSVSWRHHTDGGHAPTTQHRSRESIKSFIPSNLLNRWTANTDSMSRSQPTVNSSNEKPSGKDRGAGHELTTLASRVLLIFCITCTNHLHCLNLIVRFF